MEIPDIAVRASSKAEVRAAEDGRQNEKPVVDRIVTRSYQSYQKTELLSAISPDYIRLHTFCS